MKALELNLAPSVENMARWLEEEFPDVVFTSGRRDLGMQARVMARNHLLDPTFLAKTYNAGAGLSELLKKDLPKGTLTQLHNYILNYLIENPGVVNSPHVKGLAFDVKPMLDASGIVSSRGQAVVDFIRRSLQPHKFMLREGNLIIWHVEFRKPETQEV